MYIHPNLFISNIDRVRYGPPSRDFSMIFIMIFKLFKAGVRVCVRGRDDGMEMPAAARTLPQEHCGSLARKPVSMCGIFASKNFPANERVTD